MEQIKFNDLGAQWETIETEAKEGVFEVLRSGNYIGGAEVIKFEESFAEFTQASFSVGVSNGTDALKLVLHHSLALCGPRVAVVCPNNTFIAAPIALFSVADQNRVDLILIDVDPYFLMDLEKFEKWLVSNREQYSDCIVIATHLFGQPLNLQKLEILKRDFDLKIVEDASQAHGAAHQTVKFGEISEAVAYSLYPGKGLGAAGDAGVITTERLENAEAFKRQRNYGSDRKYHYQEIGWNYRLDSLQAVILRAKLRHLARWNKMRNEVALQYGSSLAGIKGLKIPRVAPWTASHVWHIYAVMVDDRDDFMNYLNERGIPSLIHYPITLSRVPYLQPYISKNSSDLSASETFADQMVSLPIHPFLNENQVGYIVSVIKDYFWKLNLNGAILREWVKAYGILCIPDISTTATSPTISKGATVKLLPYSRAIGFTGVAFLAFCILITPLNT